MACHILEGVDGEVVFYCSTTDWAFGPVMQSVDEAEAFREWLGRDPRMIEDLQTEYAKFREHVATEAALERR